MLYFEVPMFERNHLIYCDAQPGAAVEVFSIEQQKGRLKSVAEDMISVTKEALHLATEWLPAAAEEMNISSNIKDYVLVPVPIMPSTVPNRNQIGFPLKELSRFNVEAGCLGYETWRKKPTFVAHKNQDHTKAKGVIFDVAFRPMTNVQGDIYKAINLCGFDRERDAILANDILNNKHDYSMGAWCNEYRCSICNHKYEKKGKIAIECEHVQLGKPVYKLFNGKLAYNKAIGITGFETSAVDTGAFYSACNIPNSHVMNMGI